MRYSLPEVIELAVQTEQGGKAFYESVAARTGDKRLKQLFEFLAGEETKHVETFVELGRQVKAAPGEVPYDFEQVTLYLRSIVESRYFLGTDKGLALAAESNTVDRALEHALGFEKETLLFYTEILGLVSERNQGPVLALIAEEKEHVRRLAGLRAALK